MQGIGHLDHPEESKNLGDTTVLACEMFTSGCRLRLKNALA